MTCYFVSDTHFVDPQEKKYKQLIQFLKTIKDKNQMTHFFLLGDIFDLWISCHKVFIRRWIELLNELYRLHQLGTEIHYFEGNHDLYLKDYFYNQLGFSVHSGPKTFVINNVRVRLEHGDQIDPADYGYRFLRWFLRTPLMGYMARNLPEKWILWIGESSSQYSRQRNTQNLIVDKTDDEKQKRKETSERIKSKIIKHIQSVYEQSPFDIHISGHFHFQFDETVKNVRVINLGTWLFQSQGHLLRWDGETMTFLTTYEDTL